MADDIDEVEPIDLWEEGEEVETKVCITLFEGWVLIPIPQWLLVSDGCSKFRLVMVVMEVE